MPKHDVSGRVKRQVFGKLHTAVIEAGGGLAESVLEEVEHILAELRVPSQKTPEVLVSSGRVVVRRAGYRELLELLLRMSTASNMWLTIARGEAADPAALRSYLATVPWRLYLPSLHPVQVSSDSHSSAVYHEGLITEAAERAIKATGVEIASRAEQAVHHIRVRLRHDRVRVELSLAGDPLWHRNYRASFHAKAPLREDLAQACIKFAVLPQENPDAATAGSRLRPDIICVPLCGSGTLLFESLIYFLEIPPFLLGREYAYRDLSFPPPPSDRWLRDVLRRETRERVQKAARQAPLRAFLTDVSESALEDARQNWQRFCSLLCSALEIDEDTFPVRVEFRRHDITEGDPLSAAGLEGGSVFVPLNPPYGKRMKGTGAGTSYGKLADWISSLSLRHTAVSGFVLAAGESDWKDFLGHLTLPHTGTRHITQGGLDIRCCAFSGSSERTG